MSLFREIDLSKSLDASNKKMNHEIDSLSNDEIMANDAELLADNMYEKYYIQPVTIGDEDFSKRSIRQGKIHKRIDPFFRDIYGKEYVELDGIIMTFYFPYSGEKDLFKCHASTFTCSGYPEILLADSYFSIVYERSLQEMDGTAAKEEIMKSLANDIKSICDGISFANRDVESFNSGLRSSALNCLTEKKKKVESFYSVAALFEVPVKKGEYSETHVPLTRKISPIAHTYKQEPTYCISEQDYNDILTSIKHTGSTYERTPSSYQAMHEEDIRNTMLATLNATYMGDAMGEAFRNHGKTDICIERDNRAAFVAECKMWTGQNEVEKAIKQLDSYLTWRDCKTALIYFVRRKDFLKILTTAKAALEKIPMMRQVQEIDRNEFKCTMVSECNPGQIVQVRVMLFNMDC